MGDTANWEFAAAVAAVTMGLGGLLLFTVIATIGSWRVYDRAHEAAAEAAASSVLTGDLARQMAAREAATNLSGDLSLEAARLSELRKQAQTLMEQQTRLHDAVKNLVEAGVLNNESPRDNQELEDAIKRLEDKMGRLTTDVAALRQPPQP